MSEIRYAVILRQTAPAELVDLLSRWAVEAQEGPLYFSSKAEWGFPAVHLELLKKGEPPLPVQIPSEFVLAIVDTSSNHPSLGFLSGGI